MFYFYHFVKEVPNVGFAPFNNWIYDYFVFTLDTLNAFYFFFACELVELFQCSPELWAFTSGYLRFSSGTTLYAFLSPYPGKRYRSGPLCFF